jgi:CHAT domain-containing protein/Tfp pilus assembly protein PilF
MRADEQANDGQYSSAIALEKEAARTFQLAGCAAGAARASLSEIVALHSLFLHEDCLAAAGKLAAELENRSYIRMRARVAREYATCAMRVGRLDEAGVTLKKALKMSRAAGYGATALELWNMDLDKTDSSGVPSDVVARAAESLRLFWEGAYDRFLLYAPLSELMKLAGEEGEKDAALYFARAGVWATSGPDRLLILRVRAYSDLAMAERDVGELAAARADFETSRQIERKVPPQYQVAPALSLAHLDLTRGDADAALAQLTPLASLAPRLSWVLGADYYTTLGKAQSARRSFPEAITAFRQTIDSATQYLSALRDEDERSGVRRGVENAYRGLIAAQLASGARSGASDTTGALGTWQSFRDFDSPGAARRAGAEEDPTLWFLELPDAYVAWFSHHGNVRFHQLEMAKSDLSALVSRFLRECSDPQSPLEALDADARQLYRVMAQPFDEQIRATGRNLVFELDGALTALPVNALVANNGAWLGDDLAITISAGRSGRHPAGLDGEARVLVVANPRIAGPSSARFPPLADSVREAEAITASFANSVVLEGRRATLSSLARELPLADIVHFAGHGYSSSGNGGLLFAPQDPALSDYQLLRAREMRGMDWSRCRLAVLSACAAAEGETHGAHNPESLIRALTRAGAPRIAASLWTLDSSSSADLMTQFYVSLKNGKDPGQAMREAQQAVRRDPRRQHPYYWAGFQVYGTT